jgi:glycosyltransferase involved in cell wall biosynthesis
VLSSILDQIRIGDFFLCASERQRDFWLGMLSALGRVSPVTYRDDPALRRLIDLVPFGIPSTPPRKQQTRIRGQIAGIGEDDFVLLWGGGIYNWFDPLTPIRAVARVAADEPRVKLFFLSTSHPRPEVPGTEMTRAALRLAEELGVLERHVFFSREWVPYSERADWLLEADVGLSTHQEHLETRFSFRTRILDYFWAGLPVLCTSGDGLADQIESQGLGLTVAPGDELGLCRAIRTMLEDDSMRREQSARVRKAAQELTWERVARPLVDYCDDPRPAADRMGLPLPTDAVPVPLRSDELRAAMAGPPARAPQERPGWLQRIARVLKDDGPRGVVRRISRRLAR